MSLTNSQYDRIQREYSRRLAYDLDRYQERREEVYEKIPALRQMEELAADLSFRRVKERLTGDEEAAARTDRQLQDIREEKKVLLISGGYAEDYLEMQYTCPACRDTGYVNGKECSCRKKMVIGLLYDQSTIREILKRENFSTFSWDFYDKTVKDTGTGLSSYDTMRKNVDICLNFIADFREAPGSLLFMGQAGTGKTFLSNCIARELMERYYSVIYMSSVQFFEALARQTFRRQEETDDTGREQLILDCDLLIIDDLGTEMNNTFVGTELFYVINERILRRKATIISTNLGMNDIQRMYTERVASRIIGSYQVLRFPDQDIRILKKIRSKNHDDGE